MSNKPKMIKHALIASLSLLAMPVAAQPCHYYWSTDCFEIRDARSRDITHHVLVSGGVYARELAGGAQCNAEGLGLSADHLGDVLKRFNRTLKKIDGCKQLDSLTPDTFSDATRASQEWRRLQKTRAFKQVHEIRRLPED